MQTPGTSNVDPKIPCALKREIDDAVFPERHENGRLPAISESKGRSQSKPEDRPMTHISKRADSGKGERTEERLMGRHALRNEGRKSGRR